MTTYTGWQHTLSEFTNLQSENCLTPALWGPSGTIGSQAPSNGPSGEGWKRKHSAHTLLYFVKDAVLFKRTVGQHQVFSQLNFFLGPYVALTFKVVLCMTHLQFRIFCSDILRAVTKIIMWQNMVGAGE